MYICVCKAINEDELRALVEDGTVNTYACAREYLDLGTCCGKCKREARSFIADAKLAAKLGTVA